jgi:hypothetical protein
VSLSQGIALSSRRTNRLCQFTIGDTKMQTEGKMDQVKGKAQNAMGSAKDALKK